MCVALGVWLMPRVSVSRLGKPPSDFSLPCRWKMAPVSSHSTLSMSLGVSLTCQVFSEGCNGLCGGPRAAGPRGLGTHRASTSNACPHPKPGHTCHPSQNPSTTTWQAPSQPHLAEGAGGTGVCELEPEPLAHGKCCFRGCTLSARPRPPPGTVPVRLGLCRMSDTRRGGLLSQAWRSSLDP